MLQATVAGLTMTGDRSRMPISLPWPMGAAINMKDDLWRVRADDTYKTTILELELALITASRITNPSSEGE
jgi:hypothetical protein